MKTIRKPGRPVIQGRDSDTEITIPRLMRDADGEYVYFARIGATVKIGHTRNLRSRMMHYGASTVLLHLEPGTHADEQALHKRFRPFRAHSIEYYGPAPHLLRYINERRAQCYGLDPIDWRTAAQPKAS